MALRRVLSLATVSSKRSLVSKTLATFYKAAERSVQPRFYSSGSEDADFVTLHPSGKPHVANTPAATVSDDLDYDDDAEDMVAVGPSGSEYGGPTRGGKLKEPTRFGDWERKGRCSDF